MLLDVDDFLLELSHLYDGCRDRGTVALTFKKRT